MKSSIQPAQIETTEVEHAPISSRSKNIRLFLAVLITLGTINAVVYFSGAFTNLDSGVYLIRSKWDILAGTDEPIDWLILGDSSANQAVVPDQLEAVFGARSVNLGTVGNLLLINDVWMLQEHIEKHGAPENVVVVHVYDMWSREARPSVFAHTPWKYANNDQMFPSVKEKLQLLWFRYVPLYQSSTQVFRALATPSKMFSPPISMANDGYTTAVSGNRAVVGKDIAGHAKGALSEQFVVSKTNEIAIDMLVDLADTHGIKVFVANSPVHEDLVALDSFDPYFSNVVDLLDEMDNRSPNIHYVLRDTPAFDSSVMENADHITFDGATVFTSKLISDVQATLSK